MMYSNLLKQMLVASIDELSKIPENYAVHPQKNFTRNRKISFHDFLFFLRTMEDVGLRAELYHFFGRSDETPSKALIVKVVVSKNIYFLFFQVIRYCSVPDVSINKLSTFIGNHVRHRIQSDYHHFE